MDCNEVLGFAGPYNDSELDQTTTFLIQKHLQDCASCRTRYAEDLRFERTLNASIRKTAAAADGDAELWGRVLTRAHLAKPAVAPSRWGFFLRTRAPLHWFSLAASLIMLSYFMSAGFGFRHARRVPAPPPAQTPAAADTAAPK